MTLPAQRVQIVTTAEAVEIINACLFGENRAPPQPRVPFRRRAKRSCTPFAPASLSNTGLLDEVVLEDAPAAAPPVVPPVTSRVASPWRLLRHPGFLPGLCYLAAVRECNVHKAVWTLGYYPTVFALRNSPLIEQHCAFVVPQRTGLFHLITN